MLIQWPKLISTLFNSVNEKKAKEHIKKWIVDVVNARDSKLFNVMVKITIDSLNKEGYTIPVDEESEKLSKFLEFYFKGNSWPKQQWNRRKRSNSWNI